MPVLLAVAYLALGVAFTWPLVFYLPTAMPYTHHPPPGHQLVERAQGDYLQFYYFFWLFRETVLGQAPWLQDPYQFAVPGITTPVWTYFFPLSLVFLLVSPLGGPVAYNVLVLLSFPAAGISMALLARQLGIGWPGASAAGAIFALFPYRLAVMLGGHPTGFVFFLFPLVFLLVELTVARRSLGMGVLAGLAVLCLPTADPHMLYFLGLVAPFYLLWRLPAWVGGEGHPSGAGWLSRAGRALKPLAPTLVLAVLAVGYMFYVKAAVLDVSIVGEGRALGEIRLFSPRPADLLVRAQAEATRVVYPGVVAVLLAAVGAVSWRRWRSGLLLGLAGLLALTLSFGPNLRPVPIYDLFHLLVPFGTMIRQTAKFQLLVAFALALLAAWGLSRLRAIPRWGRWAAAAAFVLLLADYTPAGPTGVSLIPQGDTFYRRMETIQKTAGSGPILYLPIWPGESSWSSVYLYATTLLRHPTVNGYVPTVPRDYPDAVYRPLGPMNFGEVRAEQYDLLRRLGVRAVVLDHGVFPTKVTGLPFALTRENLRASPYLELVEGSDPLWVFKVREEPEGTPTFSRTSPQGLFFEAEWLPRQTGGVAAVPGASGGRVLRAEGGRDRAGFLQFGPYRPAPTGRYVATFSLRGDPPAEGALAWLDVAIERGQRILAETLVGGTPEGPSVRPDEFSDVELRFEVPRPALVEYRVRWLGQGWLEADYVYVRFEAEEDPAESFEVAGLAHAMGQELDPEASGGVALMYGPPLRPRHPFAEPYRPFHLLSGPYRRYPAGDYRAAFRVKVVEPSPGPIMSLSVGLMPDRLILAQAEVPGDAPVGEYREIALPFSLERPGVIEFLAQYLGSGVIALDRVTVGQVGTR